MQFSPRQKIQKYLRSLDLSSVSAFIAGIVALIISFIIGILTLFKLLEIHTNFVPALLISLVVFFVFTPLYTFIFILGLNYFQKNEDVL